MATESYFLVALGGPRKTLLIGGYLSSGFPHHTQLDPALILGVLTNISLVSFFRSVTNDAFLGKKYFSSPMMLSAFIRRIKSDAKVGRNLLRSEGRKTKSEKLAFEGVPLMGKQGEVPRRTLNDENKKCSEILLSGKLFFS